MLTVALTLAACGLTGEPAALMERIVAVESRGSALAMNVNGGEFELVHQPRDVREAVAMARWLLTHGYNFDAGLAQVNSSNFSRLGLTIEGLFDACTNLRAGLRVLAECRSRAVERFGDAERARTAAISCYNTGDFKRGIRNGYAAAVQGGAAGRSGRGLAPEVEPDKREQKGGAEGSDLDVLGRRVADVFGEAAGR